MSKDWDILLNNKSNSSYECDIKITDDDHGNDSDSQNENNLLSCHICIEPFSIADKVSIPLHRTCDHNFHEKCIKAWLKRNNTCPCCRNQYIITPEVKETRKSIFALLSKAFHNEKHTNRDRLKAAQFCQVHGIVILENNDIKDDSRKDEYDSKTVSLRSTEDLAA